MANGLTQYLKDTRSELNHVAWPTRTQTIVFTVLVALISLGIAAYLGLFDYIFTTSLARLVGAAQTTPSGIQVTQQPATTGTAGTTNVPTVQGPTFTIPAAQTTKTPTK